MSKSITKADLKLIKLCDRFNKNSENLAKDMIEIGRELLAKKTNTNRRGLCNTLKKRYRLAMKQQECA